MQTLLSSHQNAAALARLFCSVLGDDAQAFYCLFNYTARHGFASEADRVSAWEQAATAQLRDQVRGVCSELRLLCWLSDAPVC